MLREEKSRQALNCILDLNRNMSVSMVMRQLSLVKANTSHKVKVNAPFLAVKGGQTSTRTYLPPRDDTV